jgi:KDO2-lipid IV(A) lauroyltransferase
MTADAPLTFSQKLRYGAEAALFFAFMGLFRVLGLDRASALGGWIGRTIFSRLPPDRIARTNLAAAFPEKPSAERDTIRMAMWDNLGRVVAEYPHLEKFLVGPGERIQFIDNAQSRNALADGKGLMFLSAHLANWEMMLIVGEQLNFNGAAVVRPPNNPHVSRWIAKQRGLNGPKLQLGKHSGMRRMFTQLRGGKSLYMLVDQKLDEGLAIPFFGRDAMTTPAPAALALKLGSRIVIASNRRINGSHFEVTVNPLPEFTSSGDEAQDIKALTEAITTQLEEIIRHDPSQWLWIHRRWGKGPASEDINP